MTSDICTSYKTQTLHFILPPSAIFKYLCVSYDKTELFMTSLIRTSLYIFLFYLLDTKIDIKGSMGGNIVYYTSATIVVINMLLLMIVLAKRPKYNKDTMS